MANHDRKANASPNQYKSPILSILDNSPILDKNWVAKSFLLPKSASGSSNMLKPEFLYFTTAKYKFVNTSFGGNLFVNPPPQFTPFADPPTGGMFIDGLSGEHRGSNGELKIDVSMDASMGIGLGRYYSESIDDWGEKVSLRFGFPEYKGLLTFFTQFYDGSAAVLGRTGRLMGGLFYYAGRIIGTLIALPYSVLIWVGEAVRFLFNRPSSRYYVSRPAMPIYWQRVNQIANMLASNLGLTTRNAFIGNAIKPKQDRSKLSAGTDANSTPDGQSNNTQRTQSNSPTDLNSPSRSGSRTGEEPLQGPEGISHVDRNNKQGIKDLYKQFDEFVGSNNEGYADNVYEWGNVQKMYPNMFMRGGGVDVYWLANKVQRMQVARRLEQRAMLESLGGGRNVSKNQIQQYVKDSLEKGRGVSGGIEPGTGLAKLLDTYHSTNMGKRFMALTKGGEEVDLGMDIFSEYALQSKTEYVRAGRTGVNAGTGQADVQLADGTSAVEAAQSGQTATTSTAGNVTTGQGQQVTSAGTQTASSTATNSTSAQSTTNNGQESDPNGVTSEVGNTPESTAAGITNRVQQQWQEDPGAALQAQSSRDNLLYAIVGQRMDDARDIDGSPLTELFKGWTQGFSQYFEAQMHGGGDWINFRVDAVRQANETFSNSVGPSEIEGAINGMSSSAAAVRFGLGDFNTGLAGIDTVIKAVRDTFAGIADGLHISGLSVLMGSGFVDIPQRWQSSSFSLPSMSFTIKCRPPYGNLLSRYLNMYLPIACLLAASLPISYGRHAYGAPFLCECYLPGKVHSRLGMITSLSISRGEGNLGWTKDGDFLGCDITFEVTDLSTIMHAPIDTGLDSLNVFRWLITDDNVFNDYIAALSNLSVHEMTHTWEKLKRNLSQWLVVNQNFKYSSRVAMTMSDTALGRMYKWAETLDGGPISIS